MRFSRDVVKNNQIFLNKLWNVARFVWMNCAEDKAESRKQKAEIMETDLTKLEKILTKNWDALLDYERWILSRLKHTRDDVTEGMEGYNFSMMGEKLISFTRDEFADYAIECFKLVKDESLHGKEVMMYTLLTLLKLWHPYIPFITETLTQTIDGKVDADGHLSDDFSIKNALMTSEWPACDYPLDRESEEAMKAVFDVVTAIRTIRGERRIKPGELVDIVLYVNPRDRIVLEKNITLISGLGKARDISFTLTKDTLEREKYTYGIAGEVEIFVDTSICNHDDDIERLTKLIEEKEDYVRLLEVKLMDPSFAGKAPENVIRLTQEKKEITLRQIEKAKEEMEQYQH